jgi:hypothetical protein
MKNIHVLPTDKPSRLWMTKLGNLTRCHDIKPIKEALGNNVNIYITSDEKIKEVNWFVKPKYSKAIKIGYEISQADSSFFGGYGYDWTDCKKIILTTDPTLIANGVQAIDDEFLEWFVKNPTCEYVGVETNIKWKSTVYDQPDIENGYIYEIIIPKEEPLSFEEFRKIASKELLEKFDTDCLEYSEDGDFDNYFYANCKYWESKLKEKPKQECKDCNGNLTDCTCIEDTIDMKQETLEEAKKQQFKYDNLQDAKEISSRIKVVETLEEFAERLCPNKQVEYDMILEGAKWQQEQYKNKYSEEEVLDILGTFLYTLQMGEDVEDVKLWFEQFKNK